VAELATVAADAARLLEDGAAGPAEPGVVQPEVVARPRVLVSRGMLAGVALAGSCVAVGVDVQARVATGLWRARVLQRPQRGVVDGGDEVGGVARPCWRRAGLAAAAVLGPDHDVAAALGPDLHVLEDRGAP